MFCPVKWFCARQYQSTDGPFVRRTCVCPLIADFLKPKVSSTGNYLAYSAVCVAAITGDFSIQLGYLTEKELVIGDRFFVPADCTDNDDRLTHVFSDYFYPASDKHQFVIKTNMGPSGAPIHCHSIGLGLVTLLSATGGVNQSKIVSYSSSISGIQMFWRMLAFLCV